MAGNFIKGGFIKLAEDDKVLIDNNEAFRKKLEVIKASMESMEDESTDNALDEFSEGIDPTHVARLVDEDGDGVDVDDLLNDMDSSNTGDDDFTSGLALGDASGAKVIGGSMDEANARYNDIIAQAEEDAETIRTAAKEEGHNEGFEQGYNEGLAKGEEETRSRLENEYNTRLNNLQAEYAEKEAMINSQLEERMAEIEPLLVNKIMDVIKHVTGIELEGNKETIIAILKSALENMDSGKNYLIHVSSVDIENVRNNKDEILRGTGLLPEAVEIIEDNTVPANGALIESDAGIFDCGLGSQLELLKKKLLLISFE